MNIDEAIKERASCRQFQQRAIKDRELYEIIDAARYAPSPKNRQPWRFAVLRGEDKRAFVKLIETPPAYDYGVAPYEKLNEFNSEKETYRIMREADTIILVFNAYPSQKVLKKKDSLFERTNIQAIGAAIQNMILKATELEIGSLWICDIYTHYQQICDQYYKDGQLIAGIALGYPAGAKQKTPRKPLRDMLIDISNPQLQEELIWVGPRESDLCDCGNLFCGSVTIFGSGINHNVVYCAENQVRIDHNIPSCVENSFWVDGIRRIKKHHPNAKIMFYNSEFSSELPRDLDQDVICRNSISLLKMLGDKSAVRMAFSQLAPIVPFQELTYGKNFDLSALFPNFSKLVFQESRSSGGYGTHITEKNDINRLESFVGKPFMVSPYFEQSVSANIHMVIGEETLLYFPGSMQIMRELDGKLLYLGADYITFRTLPPLQKEKLRKFSNSLGSALQGMGYRGVVGFDFLITKDEVMFVEVNARFQASTPLLNKALKESGLPTLQDMQLAAFSGGKLPSQERLDALSVPYSMICYLEGTWDKPYDFLSGSGRIREIADVHFDGFSPQKNVQKNAYLFKVIFNTNCSSINPDCTINLYENLLDVKDEFYNAIVNREKLEVKISLLNQGVRISKRAKEQIQADGKIRSAVFSAVDLTIFDSLQVNCPKALKFSEFTPWEIDINDRRTLTLFFHRFPISDVTLDMEDIYCNNLIKPGVKFSDVCFWATDRLRVHHNLSCCMKDQGVGCRFCEVAPSDNQISIGDILKVVDFYLERADTFRHFLIGGGSEPREIEYKNILRIVNHIRQKSAKDIYVMSLPPKDLHVLAEYYAAGVTEIGFNMELFNPEAALRYMPGKGKISRQEYLAALKEAVKYWGNTGNVRSLMIVGLEEENSLLQGIRQLCEIGVMPILSVFRPIPGTDTQHVVPPSNRFLRDIYQKSATICREFGLHLGPKCVACQNNTLSLPF